MRIEPERLSHWNRVTFAARCARRVQPLFLQAWPNAIPRRVQAVEQAIRLAEQSAIEQRQCDGLHNALLEAVMAAGRALIPYHYDVPIENVEPTPICSTTSLIASLSAKVAEKAVETARSNPRNSSISCLEAYGFAVDAINKSGKLSLLEVLEADFETLLNEEPPRPWWHFW